MRALWLVVLLTAAVPAAAQDTAQPAPTPITQTPKNDHPSLRKPIIFFGAAAATDWASTLRGYHFNGYSGNGEWFVFNEVNPTINWLEDHPVRMVALGAAIDIAGVVAWKRLTRSKPRLAAAGLYVAGALRLAFAARNEIELQRSLAKQGRSRFTGHR